MSLGGRLKYKSKGKAKGPKTKKVEFVIKGKIEPAEWEDLLRQVKALLDRYHINIVRASNKKP